MLPLQRLAVIMALAILLLGAVATGAPRNSWTVADGAYNEPVVRSLLHTSITSHYGMGRCRLVRLG